MSSRRSGLILLRRGDTVIKSNPSRSDVVALMSQIAADKGLGSEAPEMILEYYDAAPQDLQKRASSADLMILPAFKASATMKWVVDFSIPKTRDSSLLARHMPLKDDFEVRTTVGVLTAYRPECLLDNGEVLNEAIDWFLQFHTRKPSLSWISYWDAVRTV